MQSVSGALQLRLEQQRHWQLAGSVRDGRQPPVDPDAHRLIELCGPERIYRGIDGRFVKRLVGGAWRIESTLPDVSY